LIRNLLFNIAASRHLRSSLLLALLMSLGAATVSATSVFRAAETRSLSFYHTHTGRELTIAYKKGDQYIQDALRRINAFLYDFRTGDITEIDPALLDLIYDVRASLDSDGTYEVISAYRSPKTNSMLRKKSNGVARKSQHLLGKAIDVRLRGVDTADLRKAALAQKRGGVGYYQKSDFVHIDTGRVRFW
jgi:uncharacterized protein YcbK (DUF882 family)